MKKIILASNNQGKIDEIQAVLGHSIELIPQEKLGIPEADETELTFVENALLKARHACQCGKLPALADDSGLVVDILHGEPGIYSARYAGKDRDPTANIQLLLKNLEAYPDLEQRRAYFYCTLVLIQFETDPAPLICQGRWDGSILFKPQGHGGFGYDPIFFVPTHQCSAAEMSLAEKNRISHRGQALQQLQKFLLQ